MPKYYQPVTLNIYTVKDRRPPFREELLRYERDHQGFIMGVTSVNIVFNKPKTQKEYALIPQGQQKLFQWSDGKPMRDNDRWSYDILI